MAKSNFYSFFLLWLIILPGASGSDRIVRDKVQHVYTSQVGITERTGHNDGKKVKKYLASCNLPEGYEWCSAFVSWAFDSAGVNTLHTAWAPAWYSEKHLVYKHGWKQARARPQPGDLVLYYYPAQGRISHVGFFDKYGVPYCETVEGNTGIGNDQGVHRIKRYWGSFFAIVNRIDN